MSRIIVTCAFAGTLAMLAGQVGAQPADSAQITWEVANRFRLFAQQKDFDDQAKAYGTSVLTTEQKLEKDGDGRGWARKLGPLCYDTFRGRIIEMCERDGTVENYLNPQSARLKLNVTLPSNFANAICKWTARTGDNLQNQNGPCNLAVEKLRASTQEPTTISVVATNASGETLRAETSIKVRDIFIVGLGDSLASGEGNPTNPITLDSEGFCFRRVGTGKRFYLPGRANVVVNKSCDQAENDQDDRKNWDAKAATWLFSGCHRSLYSYQIRTALALAIENPQITVTMIPLGCTGATIHDGILNSKRARERPIKNGKRAPAIVDAQFGELGSYLDAITKNGKHRPIDLILLTIGANDIGFTGLVADIIINENPERRLMKGLKLLVDPANAESAITKALKPDFAILRQRLRAITGSDLKRVILTTYANPGLYEGGKPCSTTRKGFDAHPALTVDGEKLNKAIEFVNKIFLPTLKAYATCAPDSGCANPELNAMTFVDQHTVAFADHGFCAAADSDPAFDRNCFNNGDSFVSDATGQNKPLRCDQAPGSFHAYTPRARWMRTVNDFLFRRDDLSF